MPSPIDKVVAKVEQEEITTPEATEVETPNTGVEAIPQENEASAQIPEVVNDTVANDENVTDVNTSDVTSIDNGEVSEPEAKDTGADYESLINEIEDLFKDPIVNSEKDEEPIEKEVEPTPEEKGNLKKLLDEEINRRVALQSEKSELEAKVKYQQSLLDKQGDRQLTIMEKQKELEVELRKAKAVSTPEEIAPLAQSYQLYQEANTPVHKYRVISQALELVEKVTWVSAENYYVEIANATNTDIPNLSGPTPVKETTDDRRPIISF